MKVEKVVIGLDEAMSAMQAVIEESKRIPGRPVAVAIVDDRGDLICAAREDGVRKLCTDMAIKKAYTSAQWRRNTTTLEAFWKERPRIFTELLPDYNIAGGGVVIIEPGIDSAVDKQFKEAWYGGRGVAGRFTGEQDEALAKVGLKVLQKLLWPFKAQD